MKQRKDIYSGRHWLLLLALFAWLVPQQVSADDGYETFVDQSILYNVFVSGSNTVTITVPCYDMEGADAWIYDGNLYASWEGQSELTLFHWAAKDDIDNSQSTCPVTFFSNAPGYFNLTLGNTKNVTRLNPNNSVTYNVIRNDDKSTFSLSAVWVVPKELRGKKITLRWKVHRKGNSRDNVWLNEKGLKDPDPITLPEASPVTPPFVTIANISNDSVGKILVPWTMVPEKINKLRYEYLDANNRTVTKEVKTTLIKVENARAAMGMLLNMVQEALNPRKKGIEQPSFIAEGVDVPTDAYVGAFAYLSKGVTVGEGTQIYPQVYLGDNVHLDNCIVESRNTIRANSRYVGDGEVKVLIEKTARYEVQ